MGARKPPRVAVHPVPGPGRRAAATRL